MAIKLTNNGEIIMLNQALNQPLTLKLFKNDATITDTIEADGTSLVEADFVSYSGVSLDATGWLDATTGGDGKAQAVYGSQVSWDMTGADQGIYGYWVETDSTSPELVWIDKFSSVKTLEDGFQFAFTPKLKNSSDDST